MILKALNQHLQEKKIAAKLVSETGIIEIVTKSPHLIIYINHSVKIPTTLEIDFLYTPRHKTPTIVRQPVDLKKPDSLEAIERLIKNTTVEIIQHTINDPNPMRLL